MLNEHAVYNAGATSSPWLETRMVAQETETVNIAWKNQNVFESRKSVGPYRGREACW